MLFTYYLHYRTFMRNKVNIVTQGYSRRSKGPYILSANYANTNGELGKET